jgi:hypothetical protein
MTARRLASGAVLVLALLALLVAACDGDEEDEGAANATRTPTATVAATPRPTGTVAATAEATPTPAATSVPAGGSPVPSGDGTPALAAGWTKIEPGGETICAQGGPFAFYVHPGTVNRLVVNFQGGGACWDGATCSNSIYYDATVDETDNPANPTNVKGMADLDNAENPFKDWFQVFIPYCTGDIHWGNNVATYQFGGADHTINHKGFVNVSAVLDWIDAGFEKPEKIFVSGCSAGAYGSIMGAAYVHNLYPDVPIYQLGDAGAGVSTEAFRDSGYANWGTSSTMPSWLSALQADSGGGTVPKLYTALADHYPEDRWAQYNTAHDQIQTIFYAVMGGAGDWGQLMMTNVDEIQGATDNFEAYIAPGASHCITPTGAFYTTEVNGVKFTDWLKAMVNDQPWESVECTVCE